MRGRLLIAADALLLALAASAAVAQRTVAFRQVKVGDTGYQMCPGNIPAFGVTLNGGLAPRLEILVFLKTAPDSLAEPPLLRFDLVDASGAIVEMSDSGAVAVDSGPPWFEYQDVQDSSYRISLQNRRPRTSARPSFRVRVSLDSSKVKAESRTFQLYWTEQQPLCKALAPTPEVHP